MTVESEIEENEFKQTRVSWKNLAAEKFSNNFHIFNFDKLIFFVVGPDCCVPGGWHWHSAFSGTNCR